MNNLLLKITSGLLQLSIILTIGLTLLFVSALLSEVMGWDWFKEWLWANGDGTINFLLSTEDGEELGSVTGSLIPFIAQSLMVTIGWLAVQWKAKEIIQAVQEEQIFVPANIEAFRTMGYWLLAIAFLDLLTFKMLSDGLELTLSFELTPVLTALAAFVLAEIFKEGYKLEESNRLTI